MIYKTSWSNRFEIKPDRWVYNPTLECRNEGKQILKLLNKSWKKPLYYYHLRTGGHVEALSIHLQNQYFTTIDIYDFFGNISRSRITRALKTIIGYESARRIAKKSTVKVTGNYLHNHHLPYGFIQSPFLASICLFYSSLGHLLNHIYNNNMATISVYMDDIVISSNNEESLNTLFDEVKVAMEKSRFFFNDKKTILVSEKTEAFNIVLTHNEMKIEYDRFVRFQQAYSISDSEAQRKGIATYVSSVNKNQARFLI